MKLFCCSDIHSYYTALKKALDEAGFEKDNPDHWLVVCGDAFDRGPESEEVLYFLMSLERKILVKGNHDLLLEDLCMREFPYNHDFSNGTVRTINDIGGAGEGNPFESCCVNTLNRTAAYRATLVNYFETEKYVFVHGWIPVFDKEGLDRNDWRLSGKRVWRRARVTEWPWAYKEGLTLPQKTVVCGHRTTQYGCRFDSGRRETDYSPFYGEGLIALDACTVKSGIVNVAVIEDRVDVRVLP